MAQIAIFDIDNTLTESRSRISPSMAQALSALVDKMPVALISGGSFEDFDKQVVSALSHAKKENLYVLPTSGAEMRFWQGGSWHVAYSYPISAAKRRLILERIAKALGVAPTELGYYVYDRGSQITFSALGKDAGLEEKRDWDPDRSKRRTLVDVLKPQLPGVSMTIGGTTSIDFTEEGVDKAFGVGKLLAHLKIDPKEVVFVGDALVPGGNDEPVRRLGVDARLTKGPRETEEIVRRLLS